MTFSHLQSVHLPLVPQVSKTFVPKGAERPEQRPAEFAVVLNVVRAVVRTVVRAIGRRTVVVVEHPRRGGGNATIRNLHHNWIRQCNLCRDESMIYPCTIKNIFFSKNYSKKFLSPLFFVQANKFSWSE